MILGSIIGFGCHCVYDGLGSAMYLGLSESDVLPDYTYYYKTGSLNLDGVSTSAVVRDVDSQTGFMAGTADMNL